MVAVGDGELERLVRLQAHELDRLVGGFEVASLDEINEMLPDEINTSPDQIEELFALLEAAGIEVVDDEAKEQLKGEIGRAHV